MCFWFEAFRQLNQNNTCYVCFSVFVLTLNVEFYKAHTLPTGGVLVRLYALQVTTNSPFMSSSRPCLSIQVWYRCDGSHTHTYIHIRKRSQVHTFSIAQTHCMLLDICWCCLRYWGVYHSLPFNWGHILAKKKKKCMSFPLKNNCVSMCIKPFICLCIC